MSTKETRRKIIENYVFSYNNFDIENMLKDLDKDVVFRNIANGEINLTTNGIGEFRNQAEQAKNLFSQREQKITGLNFSENEVEAAISYTGTIAIELPNGLQPDSRIELNGKSIFRFAGGKIIEIEDIS